MGLRDDVKALADEMRNTSYRTVAPEWVAELLDGLLAAEALDTSEREAMRAVVESLAGEMSAAAYLTLLSAARG